MGDDSGRPATRRPSRVLSIGSLPPTWGGRGYGGVATLHATLLEGLRDPGCAIEVVGVVPPASLDSAERELPVPVFSRPAGRSVEAFYEDLLERVQPDAVIMHHFAHAIGVAHARASAPPPAIGIAHSWHGITFRAGEERRRVREVAAEALGGLRAVVGMSRHCLREGEALGLRYPPIAETIYHPLHPLHLGAVDVTVDERRGVAYLGSLIPRKDPGSLVRAAELLPGLDVVLAGHGELEAELRSLISSLSLDERVRIDRRTDPEVRELLLRSEVMCLPSRSETFGLAYTEALACGTPVVGFAATLCEIEEQMGIPIGEPLEADGPEAVAAAIERVRAARWDRAELRRRAVEAFDLRRASERYAELVRRVVASAAPERV